MIELLLAFVKTTAEGVRADREDAMYRAIVFILLSSNIAIYADPPQWVLEYAKLSRQYRYDDLLWARAANLKTKEQRALIKRLVNPFEPHFAPLHGEPNRIGVLSAEWYNPAFYGIHVEQVVDSDTLIGRLEIMQEWPKGAVSVEFLPYWIDGIPTSGIADDTPINLPKDVVFFNDGSKTYPTSKGASRTILKATIYPLAQARTYSGLFCVGGEIQIWKDSQNSTLAEGSLVGYGRGNVTIRALDGKETEIPMQSLSDSHQKFVRDTLRWLRIKNEERRRR